MESPPNLGPHTLVLLGENKKELGHLLGGFLINLKPKGVFIFFGMESTSFCYGWEGPFFEFFTNICIKDLIISKGKIVLIFSKD